MNPWLQRAYDHGIEDGKADGIKEGVLNSIRSLNKTMGLTERQAMAALGIPEAEQKRYIDILLKDANS